jgi:hypothetical protein
MSYRDESSIYALGSMHAFYASSIEVPKGQKLVRMAAMSTELVTRHLFLSYGNGNGL